jgi:CheY-like chemotaxis protein
MQVRRVPVELSALVRSAAQDMAETMASAGHDLQLFVADAPLVVHGDATRLAQVVLNLLTNAAKYTPDGGRIALHLVREGEQAEIRVCDNGIGIPATALSTVFDMFSQLEPALDRAKGGLGIGLALVRGIVELHGGHIHADSAGTGRGSTFTVRLPLSPDAAVPAVAAAADAGSARLRIVVVDDNQDAAETLSMALELFGCDVTVAHSAAQALDILPGAAPSVVLLDIGLPDMNGYELARRVRQLPGGPAMTLVATTGWGQQKDRERAFDAGFDHHLTKPVDFETLRALLLGVNPA